MKKTSRRNFGKQLTGALAALPIVAAIDVSGQRPNVQRTQKVEFFREHDTPPPVLLGEGSLTVETSHPFGNSAPASTGRHRHIVPDYQALQLAHIKVVDGSGEMLYRNDMPRTAEIRVLLSDGDEVKIGVESQNFYIDLLNDKDLGNAQNQNGRKRQKIYRPKKNAAELEIAAITVAQSSTANAPILFRIAKDDLNSHLEEARIMVWLE
jgi:hypothetical protein